MNGGSFASCLGMPNDHSTHSTYSDLYNLDFFFVLQTLRRDVRICEPLNNLWIFVCCLSFMLVHVKSVILGIS